MKQQNYQCSITANRTAQKAFDCINHVEQWWTENFEGSTQKTGDIWTVRFGDTYVTSKVEVLIPNKKITWRVIDCYLHWLNDKKEWNDTSMDWEISEHNDEVKIDFTHIGLVPEAECYGSCIKGWDQYVKGSLLKLITEGKGLPEKKSKAVNSAAQ